MNDSLPTSRPTPVEEHRGIAMGDSISASLQLFSPHEHGLPHSQQATSGTLLGDWTPRLAALFGNKTALVERKSERQRSYVELAQTVNASAKALHLMGVRAHHRVAVLAKNRLEIIELMFACARLGAIFVPLNWRLKKPELDFLLHDAEPTVLFVDDSLVHLVDVKALPGEQNIIRWSSDPNADAWYDSAATSGALADVGLMAENVPQAPLHLDDPWFLLYTSGTTGHPKGALLPHRQVSFNAWNTLVALGLRAEDATVTYTPLFHTGALHVLTTPLLSCGGTVWIEDSFETQDVLQLVRRGEISILFGVPTTFEMLAADPEFNDTDFSGVRLALCGGAPCPLSLIQRYTGRDVIFKQGYGLTEVGPNCLNLNADDVARKAGSAGKPNLTVSFRLLNAQKSAGRLRGELCLGGPVTCLGYWKRPEVNASTFTEDGYFRTGDLVEMDDEGFCFIVGRIKDMFISGGENVYPAEVERVLADHPAVVDAAVIGVPDERWGEVGKAFVETRDAVLDVDALRQWVQNSLANYKVPKHFVVVAELPRNASGKVQKHLLDEPAPGSDL